jgi:phosphoglycolate phosphatase
MGITPDIYDKVLMVGDRKFDVEGAKSIGIDCLGVRYGFAPEGELEEAGATYIADDMNHMIKMFEEM